MLTARRAFVTPSTWVATCASKLKSLGLSSGQSALLPPDATNFRAKQTHFGAGQSQAGQSTRLTAGWPKSLQGQRIAVLEPRPLPAWERKGAGGVRCLASKPNSKSGGKKKHDSKVVASYPTTPRLRDAIPKADANCTSPAAI
eukprot:2690670-Rhodomonas_salina.1